MHCCMDDVCCLIRILLGTLLKFVPGATGTLPINFEFESHGRGSWSLYYSVS